MDATDKTMRSEPLSVHPPKQLSFWEEASTELPAPGPVHTTSANPSATGDSNTLIENQTRIVKTVFFTVLGIALAAIHYLDG